MIGLLRGTLSELEPDTLLLDVGGVGYLVRIPLSTYYPIVSAAGGDNPASALGSAVTLRVHTHVREDAIELFGFLTDDEKRLFERLIGVSGIGPRLAQVVLSGMAPLEVLQALASGDLATLTRIPGIGKKTAERMVVELRDAAAGLIEDQGAKAPEPPASAGDDLVQALVNLGYRQQAAESTVQKVLKEMGEEAPFQELLRSALKQLSRV